MQQARDFGLKLLRSHSNSFTSQNRGYYLHEFNQTSVLKSNRINCYLTDGESDLSSLKLYAKKPNKYSLRTSFEFLRFLASVVPKESSESQANKVQRDLDKNLQMSRLSISTQLQKQQRGE